MMMTVMAVKKCVVRWTLATAACVVWLRFELTREWVAGLKIRPQPIRGIPIPTTPSDSKYKAIDVRLTDRNHRKTQRR